MLVAAHILEDFEAEPLVEAQRVLVEDEDHVAQALARPLRLFQQSLEECGADAAVLRFGQQRDVEQSNLFVVRADPEPTDGAAFEEYHVVLGVGESRVVLALLRVVLLSAEFEFLRVVPPSDLRKFSGARAGVDAHEVFVVFGRGGPERERAPVRESHLHAVSLRQRSASSRPASYCLRRVGRPRDAAARAWRRWRILTHVRGNLKRARRQRVWLMTASK